MNQYSDIKSNFENIYQKAKIAADKNARNIDDILILSVSKTHPIEAIISAKNFGINDFGENYAQELKEKQESIINNKLPQVNWHFIGKLQSNKVKYIAPFVTLIHTVDSAKLAKEISKQAKRFNRTIDILLQVNTSNEDSKSGVLAKDLDNLVNEIKDFENINIQGLMSIGSFAFDPNISIKEFSLLRELRENLKVKYPKIDFKHLSMGMTNDFEIAIEQGATIVRIGTAIFGQRDYSN